jgi:hypothetical protein
VALKKVRMDNEKEGVGSAFCHVKELFKKKKKKKKKKSFQSLPFAKSRF